MTWRGALDRVTAIMLLALGFALLGRGFYLGWGSWSWEAAVTLGAGFGTVADARHLWERVDRIA